jgi:hypothetical protein
VGRRQVDELEQQIDDLTANQRCLTLFGFAVLPRMRHQFSQDEELLNAQIFGTAGTENGKSTSTKKARSLAVLSKVEIVWKYTIPDALAEMEYLCP